MSRFSGHQTIKPNLAYDPEAWWDAADAYARSGLSKVFTRVFYEVCDGRSDSSESDSEIFAAIAEGLPGWADGDQRAVLFSDYDGGDP